MSHQSGNGAGTIGSQHPFEPRAATEQVEVHLLFGELKGAKMPVIRLARTQAEREAVFRLRYEVYAEELQRTQLYVDHERQSIEEPLDRDGNLFVAYEGSRVIGTVRTNIVRNQSLADYCALYQMERCGKGHSLLSSVTTKMIVACAHRSHTLGYQLAMAGYEQLLRDGIEHDFIDVYPARMSFVTRLGYQVHIPQVQHPEYGEVIVMRLALRDVPHLRSVGSPFVTCLEQHLSAA